MLLPEAGTHNPMAFRVSVPTSTSRKHLPGRIVLLLEPNLNRRGNRGTQGNSTHHAAIFRRRTRVVNTAKHETLLGFCLRRLECFKHLSTFLFDTERAQNATRVHI